MSKNSQSGFTLIEVLVAFVIATGSLGLLFAVHARATDTVVLSKDYALATQLAKSLIAEYRISPRHETFLTGDFDEKFDWQVRAVRLDAESSQAGETEPALRLVEIAAKVSWTSRGRHTDVEVRTIMPLQTTPTSDVHASL